MCCSLDTFLYEGGGEVKKNLRNTNGGSWQMLTFDDKGGGGGAKKTPKPAYVIHGCSPGKTSKSN